MIRRLRIKFVCINMTIVTLMLCVIFGLVLTFTGRNLEEESLGMMQTVAMEPVEPMGPGLPGRGEQSVHLPYFTLQVGGDGEILASSDYYDLSNRETLRDLLDRVSGQTSGVLRDYDLRFLCVHTPAGQQVIFADMSSEIAVMDHLLKGCLAIGAVSFLLFLGISVLLARWAVKPVEQAWKQQKQFVADASHELKTPMTVLMSSVQMLGQAGDDPALHQRLSANIQAVSQQMWTLVESLLRAARVDHGIREMKREPFDLSAAVECAVLPFDPVFYERQLELTCQLEPDLWVRGDRDHLVRVVDILLDNAQKYSVEGGRTQVTLRPCRRGRCLLAVANEGPALTDRERKQIFERFYRADPSRQRTGSYGLGLSIAQEIVQAHRGKLWAESKDGVNTFLVRLPLCPQGKDRPAQG